MKVYRFAFNSKGEIALKKNSDKSFSIPFEEESLLKDIKSQKIELPDLNNQPAECFITCDSLPSGFEFSTLRNSYSLLTFDEYYIAGKAAELVNFHSTTNYCAKCGSPMVFHTDISRLCTACNTEIWAPVSPAIIVLVSKGKDEVLLTHGKNFKGNFHGVVSGFVETGESLEECVAREVLEETGIKIKNIRYYKSQPWPYPNQLMLGFFAEYESGEIKMQEEELSDCRWFNRNNMPDTAGKISMAGMLIDKWLENK